jgi:1,4-dihydroxy-2-naphthoyl-CoA synthase
VGGDEYNQVLSERRAESVREYLILQGIPAKTIEAHGFGKTQPIASNDTPEGRQQNRRVELILSGDVINAQEALALGMINKIVPEASLAEETSRFVEKFKKLSGTVLKLTKEATLAGLNDDMDRGLKVIEKIYLDRLMKTNDAIEGLKAFLDKRKPAWKDS